MEIGRKLHYLTEAEANQVIALKNFRDQVDTERSAWDGQVSSYSQYNTESKPLQIPKNLLSRAAGCRAHVFHVRCLMTIDLQQIYTSIVVFVLEGAST